MGKHISEFSEEELKESFKIHWILLSETLHELKSNFKKHFPDKDFRSKPFSTIRSQWSFGRMLFGISSTIDEALKPSKEEYESYLMSSSTKEEFIRRYKERNVKHNFDKHFQDTYVKWFTKKLTSND